MVASCGEDQDGNGVSVGSVTFKRSAPPPEQAGEWEETSADFDLYVAARNSFYLYYDFGDVWSRYHRLNREWREQYSGMIAFGYAASVAADPDAPTDPTTGEPEPPNLRISIGGGVLRLISGESYTDQYGNTFSLNFTINYGE